MEDVLTHDEEALPLPVSILEPVGGEEGDVEEEVEQNEMVEEDQAHDVPTAEPSDMKELPITSPNGRKYFHEEPQHENWPKHKKHIFILSNAGKPIYSRYGNESSLAGFCGVIQAFISFIDDDDDCIRSVKAGDVSVVFLLKGPVYLVCVARTGEPISQLEEQLHYMHAQILSILTNLFNKILDKRARFDIRNLLAGTEKFLDSLMSWMDHDHSVTMDATHCLRLDSQTRNMIGNIMHSTKKECNSPNLLYSILIARHQVVNLVRPRKHLIHPSDIHLILNFVNTCTAFRTSETWTPLCLPKFDESGFLHAYVCYIATDLCLVQISTHQDDFYKMSSCRNLIVKRFEKVTGETSIFDILKKSMVEQDYSPSELKIPGLLHFVYKILPVGQITCPRLETPYNNRHERKRLFRMYQHVHEKAKKLQHKVYYQCSDKETVLVWVTGGFHLYATFGPFENIATVIGGCNALLRWVSNEETNTFIKEYPMFN